MLHERPEDLDWLAFRYIADELSPDETVAFENRLASDQAAREAVAGVVDLTCAVAVVDAEDHTLSRVPSLMPGARRRVGLVGRLAWTGIAASVCLVVVLAYQHYHAIAPVADSQQNSPGGEPITTSDGRSEQLAVLWSRTLEELASVEFADWAVDLRGELDDSAELPLLSAEDEANQDVYVANAPPSWMLAAVCAADGGLGAGDHGNSGPEEN